MMPMPALLIRTVTSTNGNLALPAQEASGFRWAER